VTRVTLSISTRQRRLARKLRAMPPTALRALGRDVARTALDRALTYTTDDGRTEVMPLLLAPALLSRADAAYLHRTCVTLLGAVAKTAIARRTNPAIRELLHALPEEEEWFALAPPSLAAFVGRFDMNVDPVRGARSANLLEWNGCAIGGIHYGPTTSQTVLHHVVPLDPAVKARAPESMTDVWLDVLLDHCQRRPSGRSARRGGRPGLSVVWLEDRDWDAGITEGPTLAERLGAMGHTGAVADPRELELRGDDILHRGRPVDVLYRGIELRDLLLIEADTGPLTVLREAVRRNRVLSPLEGDLDHKSLLEVWSSERFAKLFTAAERAVFRRHVLWTRLCTARRTDDARGRDVDLPAYARKHRTALVLKPNRACGGEGILVGKDTTARAWDRAIDRSVSGADPAVVQTYIKGATIESPVVRGKRIHHERHFTNFGLFASPSRLGILGRAAPVPVVNVSRGGGILGVLIG
jgi:hypothetical protein